MDSLAGSCALPKQKLLASEQANGIKCEGSWWKDYSTIQWPLLVLTAMKKGLQIITSLYLSQMPFIVFKTNSYTASVRGGLNLQVLNNHCSKMSFKNVF